ncbi:hypothetical protein [Nocardioides sp. GXZ039]|uniref:hypothetical protein n=1 Tax=Nocardioides sp. GXZ039 TaxID=3136018 RepID=UPI0030F4975E
MTPEETDRLRELLARHNDPSLHAAVWDYREGRIDRRALMTHPAFAAAMRADAGQLKSDLAVHGATPEWLHARLAYELAHDPDLREDANGVLLLDPDAPTG